MKGLPRLRNCLEAIPLKELVVNGGSSPAFWEVLVVLITCLSFDSDEIFVVFVVNELKFYILLSQLNNVVSKKKTLAVGSNLICLG
jgi:hypothetical protein